VAHNMSKDSLSSWATSTDFSCINDSSIFIHSKSASFLDLQGFLRIPNLKSSTFFLEYNIDNIMYIIHSLSSNSKCPMSTSLEFQNLVTLKTFQPSIRSRQRQLYCIGQGLRRDAFQGLQPCTGILRSVARAALCIPICQPSKSWPSWSWWSLDIRIILQLCNISSLYGFLVKTHPAGEKEM